MEVNINQQKIAIGDKYKIFTDGQQSHFASRHILQFFPEIKLYRLNEEMPSMIVNKLFSWFKAKYNITKQNNAILEFRTKSFWKLHYQCSDGMSFYDIYGHKGRKYSVYKNDKQIAYWDKEAVSWFAGDNYKIVADNDCEIDLVIAFCLVIDNYANNDKKGTTITYDVGNIAFETKKFDVNWTPKI